MPTLAQLKTRIAEDLHRNDCSLAISDAIDGAIRYYSRDRWWFTEGRADISTTSSVAFYPFPSDLKKVDNMLITVSGGRKPWKIGNDETAFALLGYHERRAYYP